ncbi:MAG: MBL fold metallo-hydrolase [Gammaproteobacteria bacterium]|nr:MBL fold metallo-hydrolase [Gammaproteobacteria bacterium]
MSQDENPYAKVTIPFDIHKVDGKPVYYIIGSSAVPSAENQGHTSNAGFVVTDEGVVVFDALGTPALGYRMIKEIRRRTNKPIKYVVVSHYHADHIYGLQAFEEHVEDATIIAQEEALGYIGGNRASQGEAANRRLEQRREALFPWVDENTYLVEPDTTFKERYEFELGGYHFELLHMGPAHAPGDSTMYIPELRALFSGDVIYKGRLPFLDSPETNTKQWLKDLKSLTQLQPRPEFIIPGHGVAEQDVEKAIRFTHDYIAYLRQQMGQAVANFVDFETAYENTDWSRYEDVPTFDASNKGNAYRIYLEMEHEQF